MKTEGMDVALSTSQVALYGANPSEYAIAISAAVAAGIPLSQVTGDFDTAATWVYGDGATNATYLVIAVGGDADLALYYNPCGWTTSVSGVNPCNTPFYHVSVPADTLPAYNHYESAYGATAMDSVQLAMMLAYYAVNGSYPSGMSTLPTVQSPPTCSTSLCDSEEHDSVCCPATS